MLRYVARAALSTAKWGGKKSMWAGLVAFVGWSAIEMYDGAHDRLQSRYVQAKDAVVPPAESTYDKVATQADKLWTSIEDNPGPSLLALAVFALTIVYHKMHGKGFREAITATVLRSEPKEPNIILKAKQDLLFNQLVSTETVLNAQIANLPVQILNAAAVAETLQREAIRANETALTKEQRARSSKAEHERLVKLLETAKQDLVAVREQLGA